MNRPPADENGRNFFHAIAAVGQLKLATRTLATTPRKVVIGGLTAKDKRGRTPLHLAAYAGHLKVLRVFADAAPDAMCIRDQDGNSVKEALRRPNASVVGDPADTRYFQRMVAIDKLGYTFNEFPFGPADVWDLAVSNTSTAVIVQPTWGDGDRMLYLSTKGTMTPVDLGPGNVPRFVANSNLHTLVLTEDKCFAWGKNVNGILGLETDGKSVHDPEPLSENFVSGSRTFEKNVFSALGGTTKTEIKDPLVAVACCDFHSTCCSTTKVWAWGANRGQMMGKALKNEVVETPLVVFESTVRIRSVACTDNALVVLLSNGHVLLLHNDKTTRLVLSKAQAEGEAVAARGKHIGVQTSQGKLLRFALNNVDEPVTIWASRRPKDAILAFDISENGAAIVATKAGVYKIEDGRDLTEMKDIKGMQLTALKTDSQGRSFVGAQRVVAGLGYQQDAAPVQERYAQVRTQVRWGASDSAAVQSTDMIFHVADTVIPVHKALVYARCPALRPLIEGKIDMTAPPGGSAIFHRTSSGLTISHVPSGAVRAFVESLSHPSGSAELLRLEKGLASGSELLEYLALRRLVIRDLGEGLWEARLANIGCNVDINGRRSAHSQVLSSASPVMASQLQRWGADVVLPDLSDRLREQILRFAYTMDLDTALLAEGMNHSKAEQTQLLFELWQVADELLMSCLSVCCERKLFEMLDFDLVEPLLRATTGPIGAPATKLRSGLLDVVARYMDYFWRSFAEFDKNTVDSLELAVKALEGTEEIDQALADSFEELRLLAQAAQPAKKKKPASSVMSPGPAVSPTPSPPLSSAVAAKSASPSSHKLAPKVSSHASAPVIGEPLQTSESGGRGGGGVWIQARRKSRTSSHNLQEKSGSIGRTLASPSPSSASSPPVSAIASSPGPSASAPWSSAPRASFHSPSASPGPPPLTRPSVPINRSKASASSTLGTQSVPGGTSKPAASRMPSLPQLGRPAPKQDTSKLGTLPDLPTLGSQPTQRTGSAGRTSRPKFNQKDRKKLQQFDDPFALVQEMESKTASPWKQVTAASSQSVLERLERVHQINNKRTSNGSVWGV